MSQYYLAQFDHLGEDGFEDFLNNLLKEIFGPSLVPFGKGQDGGRDAIYNGIPQKYEKIEGYWIFQYKFHEIARVGNSDAKSRVKADIPKEIEKVLNRPMKPKCYILITNAELYSSDFGDWLDTEIKTKYGPSFDHLDFWDAKRLYLYLRDPDLSKLREMFFSATITNLDEFSDLIRNDLVKAEYPGVALSKIRAGIYSQNFNWFNDTLRKYYNLVNEFVKSELAEITLIWVKKYPDRSRDFLETLFELFKPIDLSFDGAKSRVIENQSIEEIADILLQLIEHFQKSGDKSNLRRTKDFILTRFDLISDNTGYYFSTPPKIYQALTKLSFDLSDLYKTISQISFQFSERFGQIYKGYEHIGGGRSQSGSDFSLSDSAIVDDFLVKVFQENYKINPNETWLEIEEQILNRKVSKSNPHWVMRATIPILLDRLKEKSTEHNAYKHLIKLIKFQQGIPSSSDKIFYCLRNDIDDIAESTLIGLIETDIAKFGIPTNVFVVILLFELINRDSKKAISILLGLLENEKYLEYDWFTFDTLVHFHILKNKPDIKLKVIGKLLDSETWRNKAQEHGGFTIMADLPRAFTSMALETAIARSGDLKFLIEFLGNSSDDLKIKIVFESLSEVAKKFPQESFSFIKEMIEDTDIVSNYIKDSYTRNLIVSIGVELANKGMGNEALWIVNKFFNDPDPNKDEESEFNYHKSIARGDEVILLTSVRGKIPWVLQKLVCDKKFIVDSFDTLKEFVDKEDNLYVIQQCIIPLIELIIRKNWLQPENKQRELHDLLFKLLHNYSSYPSIQKWLCSAFIRYRDLNEDDAEDVINFLGNASDIAPFIIYYALYRANRDKEREKFNSVRFKDILKEKIKNGNDDLRRQIAWNFWKILDDKKDEFDRLKDFMDVFASSRYSKEAFFSIFRIIEDNINDRYDFCKRWLSSILIQTLESLKSPYRPKELSYGIPFEIGLTNLLEVVAMNSTEDYLEIVDIICEMAKLDNVIFYDIRRVFEAHKVIDSKERKKILPKLESLWGALVKKNPRLVEIDWKN